MENETSQNSIHTFKSRSGARKFPRIDFPAAIEIEGEIYATQEWSVGGFSLNDGEFRADKGAKLDGLLRFDLPVGTFSTDVHFEVMRASDSGHVLGCRFYSVDSNHQKALQSIVDTYLTGESISLDNITSFGVKAQLHEEEEKRVKQNWWRFGIVALVSISIIVFAVLMVQTRILTIHSYHAAINQPLINFRATESGVLHYGKLKPGQKVNAGDPLFQINSEMSRDLLAENEIKIKSLAIEASFYSSMLSQNTKALENYREFLKSELELNDSRQQLLKEIIASKEKLLDMHQNGRDDGWVDVVTHGEHEIELLENKQLLLEQKSIQQDLKHQLQVLDFDLLTESGFANLASPFELSMKKTKLLAHIKILEERNQQILKRGSTKAPCDCYVAKINASSGQSIETGTPVIALSPIPLEEIQDSSLLALMPLERAHMLKNGMDVEYTVTSSPDVHVGQISHVQFYSAANPNIYDENGQLLGGLPETLPRLNQYTLIRVILDEEESKFIPNEPARAKVRLSWSDYLSYWLGL